MLEIIINDDLKLNQLENHQAEIIYALIDNNRKILAEWLPWVENTKSELDTSKFIEFTQTQSEKNNGFTMGIWFKGQFAGCIGFPSITWMHKNASIGYWLGEAFQGNGIVTLACSAFLEYAFKVHGLKRIEIRCGVSNLKSRAIPERLGFKLEGTLRQVEQMSDGRFIDHAVYGLLADEWLQRKEILEPIKRT